jgi:predicted metal-dependent hydrolase
MGSTLELGDLRIGVARKDIKHIHLTVSPPDGEVRISAPHRVPLDSIRLFAINKLRWIKAQQRKLHSQPREAPREYLERESHYLWGRRYLLHIVEHDAAPLVRTRHRRLELLLRPGTDMSKRAELIAAWYRDRIRTTLPALLAKWEPQIGVKAERVFIQRMKTKWGSCNASSRHLRLNTELAKKPPECLEYIVVHELVHLREPTHGPGFVETMDRLLPQWRTVREQLNRLPI